MKAVCFGEIMMRLCPPGYLRLTQTDALEMTFGGAEANVAVSLANYGLDVHYVTRLPKNPIADACMAQLRSFNVNVSDVVRGGERVGIYFVEKGASMRPSKVIYDRKHSAIGDATPADFDWEKILQGAKWLHWTGITPALGEQVAAATLEACKAARAMGVTVSCDLNYRKNLWSREKAGHVMGQLVPFVDVLIANEEDAADVFGIHAEATDINAGTLSDEGYKSVARQLAARFGNKKVAFTLRESHSANDNGWSGLLYNAEKDEFCKSKKYDIRIVDRVGGGDSFGGGLIYSQLQGYSDQDSIEFAVAASALKHTIEGDFNRVSIDEVKALMGGSASGRVVR